MHCTQSKFIPLEHRSEGKQISTRIQVGASQSSPPKQHLNSIAPTDPRKKYTHNRLDLAHFDRVVLQGFAYGPPEFQFCVESQRKFHRSLID